MDRSCQGHFRGYRTAESRIRAEGRFSLGRPRPSLWEGSDHAKLLHDRVEVCDAPMLGDPPVDDTHCVDRLEAHLPAGSRNTEEVAEMGTVISLIGHDHITVGILPMDADRDQRLHRPARRRLRSRRPHARVRV
jgi:hypothetical protein